MQSAPLSPPAMHAPDGFFAVWLSVIGWVITIVMIVLALRQTRDQLGERQIPMLNFTIPGGTSGHLLGGTLAAILLGPWAAVLVMSAVIGVQALLFQDGGLLVMGLNIINMGIITSFVGYFTHRRIKDLIKGNGGMLVGAFAGAWLSLVVTAAAAAVELAVSGTSPIQFAFPAMVGVHAIIGVGEGLLTVFALSFILSTRPDLITGEEAPGQKSAAWVLVGVLLALAITFFAPLASGYSDGMERIAEAFAAPGEVEIDPTFQLPDQPQFFGDVQDAPYEVLPDYTIPVLGETGVSTVLAGMIGVLVVFGVSYGVAALVKRRRPGEAPP
jgi:cobalt/nickel transport system permease protein